jgi:hypothetical protein
MASANTLDSNRQAPGPSWHRYQLTRRLLRELVSTRH